MSGRFKLALLVGVLSFTSLHVIAFEAKAIDITKVISKEEFARYKDVGEFIDHSPKVTIYVEPQASDIAEYGPNVVKTLTGSDCDRDGKMDDNSVCNAVYFKLWLAYER